MIAQMSNPKEEQWRRWRLAILPGNGRRNSDSTERGERTLIMEAQVEKEILQIRVLGVD